MFIFTVIPNLPPQEFPQKAYDMIVVNEYISNGLFPSAIDPFFSSPVELPKQEDENNPTPGTLTVVASDARRYLKLLRGGDKLDGVRQLSEPNCALTDLYRERLNCHVHSSQCSVALDTSSLS